MITARRAASAVPFDAEKVYGTRGRVPVCGTINGFPFRSSIVPMGGRHIMVVNQQVRRGAQVAGGDTVTISMTRDTQPRVITPPADFARALKTSKDAQRCWEQLSYTHQKEFVRSIEEAKRPETRQRRIEKSLALLAAGRQSR